MEKRLRKMNVASRELLICIEEEYLRGVPQPQIAIRHNKSQVEIHAYIQEIMAGWKETYPAKANRRRMRRVKQFERIAMESVIAFERSKQDNTEIRTTITPSRCRSCNGTGMQEDEWCDVCNGEGEIMTEVTTKSVRGQAGDASHNRAAIAALAEIAKLEGCAKPQKVKVKGKVGVDIVVTKYSDAPPELILKFMRLEREMAQAIKEQAIDVESVPLLERTIKGEENER